MASGLNVWTVHREHRTQPGLGFLFITMSKQGNPQLEDGYTKIANELLEAILRAKISRQDMLVVFSVIRQTYGWNRKEAEMSISLFEKMTGLHRRHIQRSIKYLLDIQLLERREAGKKKYGKPVYKYVINKKNWCQYGYSTIANTATEAIANAAPNKEIKEIYKKRKTFAVDNFSFPK